MAMGNSRSIFTMIICYFLLFQHCININATSTRHHSENPRSSRKPCKTLVFYFHDILYDGHNSHNATSAVVGAPAWARDKVSLGPPPHFGVLIVFDDPITVDDDLHSEPVGWAQGLYMYDSNKVLTAWFAFTFVLNSTDHKGTITFAGADPMLEKTRDIPVIGGTGDFFMTRGIATVTTGSFEGDAYFRLRTEINLYECW